MAHLGPLFLESLQCLAERCFVRLVGAIFLERDLGERQADALRLRAQQRPADAMNADAIVVARDAGEKTNDVVLAFPPERVERECAVLAATPAQNDLFFLHSVQGTPASASGAIP